MLNLPLSISEKDAKVILNIEGQKIAICDHPKHAEEIIQLINKTEDDTEFFDDDDDPNILISTDGKGNWVKREWVAQCPKEVFMHGRCQGVKGHNDVHWCFSLNGYFCWDENEPVNKSPDRGVAGTIPAGHPDYKSPVEMDQFYFLSHYTDTTITDKEEIARLEREEFKPGESINRPCKF